MLNLTYVSGRIKDKYFLLGGIAGLVFFEFFYFLAVVSLEKASTLSNFWIYFGIWMTCSFVLTFYMSKTIKRVNRLFLIVSIVFIATSFIGEAAQGKINQFVYPMLPGWFGGVIVVLLVMLINKLK